MPGDQVFNFMSSILENINQGPIFLVKTTKKGPG
jgi:hypothetical protein